MKGFWGMQDGLAIQSPHAFLSKRLPNFVYSAQSPVWLALPCSPFTFSLVGQFLCSWKHFHMQTFCTQFNVKLIVKQQFFLEHVTIQIMRSDNGGPDGQKVFSSPQYHYKVVPLLLVPLAVCHQKEQSSWASFLHISCPCKACLLP